MLVLSYLLKLSLLYSGGVKNGPPSREDGGWLGLEGCVKSGRVSAF